MINELRIGNIVFDERNCEVDVFSLDTEINHDYYSSSFKGIPITKNRLLDFDSYDLGGNEVNQYEKNLSVIVLMDKEDKFEIKFSEERYGCKDEDPSDFYIKAYYDNNYLKEVKYIHEVQNLYFALKGVELNKNK